MIHWLKDDYKLTIFSREKSNISGVENQPIFENNSECTYLIENIAGMNFINKIRAYLVTNNCTRAFEDPQYVSLKPELGIN
jgi:hypothetical protein